MHTLTHLCNPLRCVLLPSKLYLSPNLHPKPSLRPSNRVQHTHENMYRPLRLFHLVSCFKSLTLYLFFLISVYVLLCLVFEMFVFAVIYFFSSVFFLHVSIICFPLCFPSLNNRPRLSSNTADRHWELAARERER